MPISASTNFLLPDATFIPEFLAFLVVVFLVAKKIVPPINKAIEARQKQIADSLNVIDEAKVQMSQAEVRVRELTDEARDQARSIVENANRLAQQIEASAREEAVTEAARIRARNEEAIARERQQAAASLVAQTAELVVAAAERVLEAEIDSNRHRDLIERSIAAVTSAADAGGTSAETTPAGTTPAGH